MNTEQTQEDLSLEKLCEIIDVALTSNDPRIVDCLKKLMIVVALVSSEKKYINNGPLRNMTRTINELSARLSRLEMTYQQQQFQKQNTWTAPSVGGAWQPVAGTSIGTGGIVPMMTMTGTTTSDGF